MKEPLISVVIPVYKVENYLERCVESLINQTYKNLEIILVDDGSPDNCGIICDRYAEVDDRVKVIHKKNGGLSSARNSGIDISSGKYITFIDSDDWVDKEYVEYLFYLIQKDMTKISICQHKVVNDKSTTMKETRIIKEENNYDVKMILKKWILDDGIDISAWAKLYDLRLFDNIRYPEGMIFEDLLTTYKLFFLCDYISVGSEKKYKYYIHANSISNGIFDSRYLKYSEITDKVVDEIVGKYDILKKYGVIRKIRGRLSTINLMINSNVDYRYIEKLNEMLVYIKENKKFILKNKNCNKSIKGAVFLINKNYKLYKKIWNMHRKKLVSKGD